MPACVRSLALALVSAIASACLIQHPPPERPAPSAAHEVRRTAHPGGEPRREMRVLVWSDGRVERDGPEREFHADGSLAAERAFDHDRPAGLWRTWYPDGTPRAEIDHGVPGSRVALLNRFWHANGQLAAEGRALDGVREGSWSYWSASGTLERKGAYRAGKRDGPWTLYDEHGAPSAEGHYALGERVGVWTLWDAQGVAHERNATELGRDGSQ